MNTQSIIVYRSPLDQQMWEGIMSGDAFSFMVGVAVFLITYVLFNEFVVEKFNPYSRIANIAAYVAFAVSMAAGVFTIRFML